MEGHDWGPGAEHNEEREDPDKKEDELRRESNETNDELQHGKTPRTQCHKMQIYVM